MNEWQPIETAPKNGRSLLLLHRRGDTSWVESGKWRGGMWVWDQDGDGPTDESIITHWAERPTEPPK